MSFVTSPQYFGVEDHTVGGPQPLPVRVYYPTDDDLIVGAPLAPGPHPLVVFAHGDRNGPQNSHLCPADLANDHRRWTHVLGAIARSGFVVAAPAMQANPDTSAQRIRDTVRWMRQQWSGRRTLHHPLVVSPDIGASPRVASQDQGPSPAPNLARMAAPGHMPPMVVGTPTALALVGHSWGVRACARVLADGGVAALGSIAGTWDDNESITALRAAQIPSLLMCGTADSQTFSYLGGLWGGLATPKYQAAFQGAEHWDWFGRKGAIRRCDGGSPPWPDTGHIAGELLVGFLTRHVARVQFDPPHLVPIPLLRPWLSPWYDQGSAIQVRWDAPGQRFYPLPPAGEGILGPWTEPVPW